MNSKNWMLRHAAACYGMLLPNPYVQLQKTGAAACCGMLRLHMLGCVTQGQGGVQSPPPSLGTSAASIRGNGRQKDGDYTHPITRGACAVTSTEN